MHKVNIDHFAHQFTPDRHLDDVANFVGRGQYPVDAAQGTHNDLAHRQHCGCGQRGNGYGQALQITAPCKEKDQRHTRNQCVTGPDCEGPAKIAVIEPLSPPLCEVLQHRRDQEHHTGDDQFFATALPQSIEPCDRREFHQ